jgi:hypothetical protein
MLTVEAIGRMLCAAGKATQVFARRTVPKNRFERANQPFMVAEASFSAAGNAA